MPYYPNGTWYDYSKYLKYITNSSDPMSGQVNAATHANPTLMPLFTGMLYVYLWIQFGAAPTRGKLMVITGIMLVISLVMAYGGFIDDAILNFIAFIVAYIGTFLWKN